MIYQYLRSTWLLYIPCLYRKNIFSNLNLSLAIQDLNAAVSRINGDE